MKRNCPLNLTILLFLIHVIVIFQFPETAGAGNNTGSKIYIEDLSNIPLFQQESAEICSFIFSNLKKNGENLILSENLMNDRSPRMVCLSITDGDNTCKVFPGVGTGIMDAINNALAIIPDPVKNSIKYMYFDVIHDVKIVKSPGSPSKVKIQPGLEGIVTDHGGFLPSQLLSMGMITTKGRIDTHALDGSDHGWDLPSEILSSLKGPKSEWLWKFRTSSFFFDGNTVFPLYRNHGVFTDLTEELLLRSINLGIDYLERSVHPSGRFIYSYQADKDKINSGYNILRHCGTLYSMLEAYEISREEKTLKKAELAINYLLKQITEETIQDASVALVEEGGSVKLGGNALAIVALAKYTEVTGDTEHLSLMARLANWMKVTQKTDGRFGTHKMAYPSGRISSFVSSYYPGEAILSLVRLYSLDGNSDWLDIAEGAAKYLITVRDGERPNSKLPHDHWLLYGLNELYRFRKDPLYLQHAFKIADVIISKQNIGDRFPDWEGGYYIPPGSTPTATRSEGLCAAYLMAEYARKPNEASKYLSAIEKGVTFQISTQIGEENAWYFPDPMRSIGGFRKSLTDSEIRIDYVQHNLSALIGLLKILRQSSQISL